MNQYRKETSGILEKLEREGKELEMLAMVFKTKLNCKGVQKRLNRQSFIEAMKGVKEEKVEEVNESTEFFSAIEQQSQLDEMRNAFLDPRTMTPVKQSLQNLPVTIPNSSIEMHAFVTNLLKHSPVFQKYPLVPMGSPAKRDQLPVFRDSEIKINAWSILKENLGKDLTKITFPVTFNEPLTSLQKIADFFEYEYLLRRACFETDGCKKIADIFAFLFILYSTVPFRLRKPFNPLLGETFEFFEKDIKCIIEQISHHPPIAAFYCESDDYEIWGQLIFKIQFSMSGFELVPTGPFNLRLKKTDERFNFTRPRYSIHNYIVGKLYFWINGEMTCTNEKTKEKISVVFKPKGWTSANDYLAEGEITDRDHKVKYTVSGKWKGYVSIFNE